MFKRKPVIRSDRLKILREVRGLSHHALAIQVQLTDRNIADLEVGKGKDSPEIVQRLAQALGVTESYLLGLVDDPKKHMTEEDLTPEERIILAAFRDAHNQH